MKNFVKQICTVSLYAASLLLMLSLSSCEGIFGGNKKDDGPDVRVRSISHVSERNGELLNKHELEYEYSMEIPNDSYDDPWNNAVSGINEYEKYEYYDSSLPEPEMRERYASYLIEYQPSMLSIYEEGYITYRYLMNESLFGVKFIVHSNEEGTIQYRYDQNDRLKEVIYDGEKIASIQWNGGLISRINYRFMNNTINAEMNFEYGKNAPSNNYSVDVFNIMLTPFYIAAADVVMCLKVLGKASEKLPVKIHHHVEFSEDSYVGSQVEDYTVECSYRYNSENNLTMIKTVRPRDKYTNTIEFGY